MTTEMVECEVSGMHINMKDRKYITIGTVPLVGLGNAPSAPPSELPSPSQPAVLPVAPGQPAQPGVMAGDTPGGWVMPGAPAQPPPYQSLYPTLSQPVYKESSYSARSIQDRGESNNMAIAGPSRFAPYYPTYAVQPPPLPQ